MAKHVGHRGIAVMASAYFAKGPEFKARWSQKLLSEKKDLKNVATQNEARKQDATETGNEDRSFLFQ